MPKFLIVLILIAALPLMGKGATTDPRAEIETFNRALEQATRSMDNRATLALWAEDGLSLLPSTKPLEGKTAIAAFLEGVTAQIPGAKMEKFELECFGIEVSGDLASAFNVPACRRPQRCSRSRLRSRNESRAI